MIDVTVIIATCGNSVWKDMGDRAIKSALATGAKVRRVHIANGTVAEARNKGLSIVKTKYVVFLDADDALDPRYFDIKTPEVDVTATTIKYQSAMTPIMPRVWTHEQYANLRHNGYCHSGCLVDGNWIHIGAIIRCEALRAVGGFREYPIYEDWAIYLAMQQNGATFGCNFKSVYNAGVRINNNHRNRSLPIEKRNIIHLEIMNDLVKKR